MIQTETPKPYHVQAKLSPKAKSALKREKGRRLQTGIETGLSDIVSEIIEKWADLAP